ncbi:MAG: hypothetical protein ACRC8A_06780 [Microcoleaceae cyanobacterium]
MADQEPITIDGFRISGPVQGKKIEIQLDVKSASQKDSKPSSNSSEGENIGYLFLLLLGLILFIGIGARNGTLTNEAFQVPEAPAQPAVP